MTDVPPWERETEAPWERTQRCPKCARELKCRRVSTRTTSDVLHFAHCQCGHLCPAVSISALQALFAADNEHAHCPDPVPLLDPPAIPKERQEVRDRDSGRPFN